MWQLRYLVEKILGLFWWPAIVGAIFVVGFGAVGYRNLQWDAAGATPVAAKNFPLDRWNRGFFLAASVRNAALLVRPGGANNMQILLADFETGKRIKLNSDGSHLLTPYLSPDGTRLLFSRQSFERQGHDLVSCDTATLVCHTILKSAGSVYSAIEISDGRILYVSSPYVKRSDGQIRLTRNDIWIFDPVTGPRRLTDFQLYELHSLSVSNSEIYFSAMGSHRERPLIPKYDPGSYQQSDIFRLPFDPATGTIATPSEIITPLFASTGIATRPSTSADGSLIAFLRTRTRISPYRYDLVIADQTGHSERLTQSSGMGFSRPVIIGQDVYSSETQEDRVLVRVARPGEPVMKLLADIDDASIASAQTIELKIEP